jgi:hypothetical protein
VRGLPARNHWLDDSQPELADMGGQACHALTLNHQYLLGDIAHREGRAELSVLVGSR